METKPRLTHDQRLALRAHARHEHDNEPKRYCPACLRFAERSFTDRGPVTSAIQDPARR